MTVRSESRETLTALALNRTLSQVEISTAHLMRIMHDETTIQSHTLVGISSHLLVKQLLYQIQVCIVFELREPSEV